MNRSMVLKKQENKFYNQLEKQLQDLAKQDYTLVRKPSREEIVQHIDVASDLYRLTEHHKELSTVHNQENSGTATRETGSTS